MTLSQHTVATCESVAAATTLPWVRDIHFAVTPDNPRQSSNFGVIVLSDNTVGLTYVALDNVLDRLTASDEWRDFVNGPVIAAARLFTSTEPWQRAIGMGAVNAISQYLFRKSNYRLSPLTNSTDIMSPSAGDHFGMVGYFPSLVDKLRALDVSLTVIELNEKWLQQDSNFEVTLDTARLSSCNKIICTGTTLVNATLDDVLTHCQGAEQIYVAGPTASCIPDAMFARGVTVVGGCEVTDCDKFIDLWSRQQRWRDVTQRYVIDCNDYPGAEALIRSL